MRKNTLALIRVTYFQSEQIEDLKQIATTKNFDRALGYLQSDEFLDSFAEQLEQEFSNEEIEMLLKMYNSDAFKRYSRSSSVLVDMFFELKKILLAE